MDYIQSHKDRRDENGQSLYRRQIYRWRRTNRTSCLTSRFSQDAPVPDTQLLTISLGRETASGTDREVRARQRGAFRNSHLTPYGTLRHDMNQRLAIETRCGCCLTGARSATLPLVTRMFFLGLGA